MSNKDTTNYYICSQCNKPCDYVVLSRNPRFKERRSACHRAPLIVRASKEP